MRLTTSEEQIMIEQLAEHGVEPRDLTPTLMQNSRVKTQWLRFFINSRFGIFSAT
jgi:hypothetical protein